MQQRKPIPRILGAAALALLFGSASVQADDNKSRTSGASQDSASTSASGSGAASSGASASKSGQSGQSGQSQLSKDDQKIIEELAQANLAEIATGKLALERSQNPQIKQFAQQMIDDHTKSQQQLKQLADSKGVQLPSEPARKHQRMADKLAKLEGNKFDEEYRKQVGEKAHEDTHKLLERAQKDAKDPQLKALAQQTLPVVEKHLSMAESMEGKGGRTSGSSSEGKSGQSGSSSEGQPTRSNGGASSGSSGNSASGGSGASNATSGSSAPTGSSGASMQSESSSSSGGGSSGASGTSSPSSNMRGPGKQQ